MQDFETPPVAEAGLPSETGENPVNSGATDTPQIAETDEEKSAREATEAEAESKRQEEKKRKSIDKRFAELTAEKHEARALAKQLADQNAAILALMGGQKNTQNQPVSGEPTREQFGEYEDFVTARAEYRAEQKAKQLFESHVKEQQQAAENTAQQQRASQTERLFVERKNEVAKTLPDYNEVLEDWEPSLPQSVERMIIDLEEGPLIAYHLAKNPALEKKFQGQSVAMQGVILGQLLATLKAPAKVTQAPEPGKPVGTRSAPSDGEFTGNPEEYYAWAQKQQKAGKLR